MNQGTARIVIVVALLAVGVAVLARSFDADTGAVAAPTTAPTPTDEPTDEPTDTGSPTPTDDPTDEGPEPNTSGVLFMTLNGTEVTGLAADAQVMLEEAGYERSDDADDAPVSEVQATTVYYRGGSDIEQNRADAQYMATEYFDGAQIARLDPLYQDVVPPSTVLVIVLGEDYADAIAA